MKKLKKLKADIAFLNEAMYSLQDAKYRLQLEVKHLQQLTEQLRKQINDISLNRNEK